MLYVCMYVCNSLCPCIYIPIYTFAYKKVRSTYLHHTQVGDFALLHDVVGVGFGESRTLQQAGNFAFLHALSVEEKLVLLVPEIEWEKELKQILYRKSFSKYEFMCMLCILCMLCLLCLYICILICICLRKYRCVYIVYM